MNTPLACLAQSRDLSWEDKIAFLAWALKPRESKPEPIEHRFEPGWYIRTIKIPANHAFVGRPHRLGHLCKLISGNLAVMQEEGEYYFKAPAEMRTIPGYQSVVLTQTDCVVETWHPNPDDFQDVEILEAEIFDPAEPVLKHGEIIASRLDYQQGLIQLGLTDERVHEIMDEGYDEISYAGQEKISLGVSAIQGRGIFAMTRLPVDSTIAPAGKTLISRYANHSVNPNAKFDRESNTFVALRDIEPGEEVTVNYRQVMEAASK